MYHKQMYDLCKSYMHRYVLVQTNDHQTYDGIIESVDETNVYLAIPVGEGAYRDEPTSDRLLGAGAFGYGAGLGYGPGFGYPGYGFPGAGYVGYGYPGYGYYHPRRRFQRLILPLAAITALSLIPYY